jgi:hypothetical protein
MLTALRGGAAIFCVATLLSGSIALPARAQETPQAPPPQPPQSGQAQTAALPADQLDSLVAPIALYPDPLLSQTLVASTYPLEIIQLKQWLDQNKNLKDKALADAVQQQDWDASVQSLAALPDVVKQLADNIKWTTDLGNAVLAQESDVMDAVQRMRKKAQDKGALKSSEQQKVETQAVEGKSTIVVQPTNPEVVYVPSYNPSVVYGAPLYPYPPVYYPPAGYYAGAALLSFGVGVAMGAFWSGGWGWGASWGGGSINVNNNNTFVRNANTRQGVANASRGNTTWQHNPRHRGGAPYSNSALANKFGGTTRGDSLSARQSNARQNLGNTSRDFGGRAGGAGNLGAGNIGGGNLGGRSGGGNGFGGGGGRLGGGSGSFNRGAFGGAGGGFSGGAARASGSRGASSFGGARGGGRGGGRRR